MKKTVYLISVLWSIFCMVSCNRPAEPDRLPVSRDYWQPILFDPEDIAIDGDLGSFTASWAKEEIENDLLVLTLTLKSPRPAVPPPFSVNWNFPSVDIYAFWNTNVDVDKHSYYKNRVSSKAASQAPVLAFLNNKDQNRFTVACSDALNQIDLNSYIREEDARFYCSVHLFREKTPVMSEYTLRLRIDRRQIPFYVALREVSAWWADQENYLPAPVPDSARMPMYSTWYSFHQNITADEVVSECRLAKEMGFEAVIVDDGWQTLDSQRGYAYTGDWKPERIPDMRTFVDRIHRLGMKFLLWYSLPFIGEKAENYERFKGKYLRYWEGQGAYILDPRYPDVREYIIGTYQKALKEWALDGFKLDFIGFFTAVEDTVMTREQGRDYASVNDAVDRLMTDIMSRLRAANPDIMIEFRQRYIGPLMRKYGNMFRAVDCPNMAAINRARTTNIRLLCGNTSAHSDMFMWHQDEPVEVAALQILNILFSVPQLSVRLDRIPEDHIQMIKFWTEYWKKNRSVLMDGKFMPVNPGAVYPLIRAETDEKVIVSIYNDMFVNLDSKDHKNWDIVNAKPGETVVLDIGQPLGDVSFAVFDCKGNLISDGATRLNKGVHKFAVPPSGLLAISK
jgi:alpha-galactosidase